MYSVYDRRLQPQLIKLRGRSRALDAVPIQAVSAEMINHHDGELAEVKERLITLKPMPGPAVTLAAGFIFSYNLTNDGNRLRRYKKAQ